MQYSHLQLCLDPVGSYQSGKSGNNYCPLLLSPDSKVVYLCIFGSTCRGASISLVHLGVAIPRSSSWSARGVPPLGVFESFSSEYQIVMVWWTLNLVH